MNKILDKLKDYVKLGASFASRYALVLFLFIFSIMAGFLVTRIGELSRAEPTEEQIGTKLQDVKQPKIDQTAIDSLTQLQQRDISIDALFDNGRNNPFEN